jgi:hypothetical protein
MEKFEIINALGRKYGCERYLEVCAPSTGHHFADVDRTVFKTCDRLIYNCPDSYNDGLPVTFRTPFPSSYDVIRSNIPNPNSYDLVFVDPYHSYDATMTDLLGALRILTASGIIVVHDCNPTEPELVGREFRPNAWCGLTYAAFIDFCFSTIGCAYFTVDCDFGVGVVFKSFGAAPPEFRMTKLSDKSRLDWFMAKSNDHQRFAYFKGHRRRLLHLITPDRFNEIAGIPEEPVDAQSDIAAQ